MEAEIENVKKNKFFKIRLLGSSLVTKISKLMTFVRFHWKIIGGIGTLIAGIIAFILSYLQYMTVSEQASYVINKMGQTIAHVGKGVAKAIWNTDGIVTAMIGIPFWIFGKLLTSFSIFLGAGKNLILGGIVFCLHAIVKMCVFWVNTWETPEKAANEMIAESYAMQGEDAPEEIVEEIIEVTGETKDEYREKEELRKKEYEKEKFYYGMKGYLYYGAGKTVKTASNGMKWAFSSVFYAIALILGIYLLIKWIRN